MERLTDLTRLRTEGDIRLAKATLRYSALLQERAISDNFSNIGQRLLNSVKTSVIQIGTRILISALLRIIESRSD